MSVVLNTLRGETDISWASKAFETMDNNGSVVPKMFSCPEEQSFS